MVDAITWPTQVENAGATDDGIFTAAKANEIKNAVNNHKSHIETLYSAAGQSLVWASGNTARRVSVYENGVLVEYVALEGATLAQIGAIKPGTNSAVWITANFRHQVIGDGSSTSFVFTHGFADGHVNVQVRNNATGEIEYPYINVVGADVTVEFAQPPATNSYTIEVNR